MVIGLAFVKAVFLWLVI